MAKKYPYETDKDHFIKLKGSGKILIQCRVYLDKFNPAGIRKNNKGREYMIFNIMQSKRHKGEVFLSQTLPMDYVVEFRKENGKDPYVVVGEGNKQIEMDFFIENNMGGDYLEYLYKLMPPEEEDEVR